MRLCIISPHLDDAVLSCGVKMQRVKGAGGDVLVLNIFNAGTNAQNRRIEELVAEKVLGAEAFFLDELDAPDRDPRYKSEIELFHGDFVHVPEDVIARVTSRIGNFLQEKEVDAVYFPLAAGTHIDHRIAYTAGQRLQHPHTRYYEDRPYILWPGMLQARLNQLGCRTDVPAITAAEMMAGIDDYHYLTHFVPPGDFRDVCLPRYFADLTPLNAYAFAGEVEALEAGATELDRVYESLACYTSQMPFIYRDRENFVQDSLAHEKHRTGQHVYLERSWALKPL